MLKTGDLGPLFLSSSKAVIQMVNVRVNCTPALDIGNMAGGDAGKNPGLPGAHVLV